MSWEIDSRIKDADPETDKVHHTLNTTTGEVTLNPTFWGRDVDFSAMAVGRCYDGHWYHTMCPTLVSPRHCVFCGHFWRTQDEVDAWVAVGCSYRWITPDGETTVDREIRAILLHPKYTYRPLLGYDVAVGVLDAPVPGYISYARTLPLDWDDCLLPLEFIAVTWFDQEHKALVFDWQPWVLVSPITGPWASTHKPRTIKREAFFEAIISGDSGFPCFAIYNSEPLLLMAQTHRLWGGSIPLYCQHAEIDALMAALDAKYYPDEPAVRLEYPDLSVYAFSPFAVSARGGYQRPAN